MNMQQYPETSLIVDPVASLPETLEDMNVNQRRVYLRDMFDLEAIYESDDPNMWVLMTKSGTAAIYLNESRTMVQIPVEWGGSGSEYFGRLTLTGIDVQNMDAPLYVITIGGTHDEEQMLADIFEAGYLSDWAYVSLNLSRPLTLPECFEVAAETVIAARTAQSTKTAVATGMLAPGGKMLN